MLADKAAELGLADEVSETPEKQSKMRGTECDRYELCIQCRQSQADAKPASLVEQIKAKQRRRQLKAAEPTEDATEPETKTDEPAALEVAPEAGPTDEAEQSEAGTN